MEIETYIKRKKHFYSTILNLINADTQSKTELQTFIKYCQEHEILTNKEKILTIFQLISLIAENHQRDSDFFNKIETIFQYLLQNKQVQICDSELFNIFYDNKRILFLLFEKGIIQPNQLFINNIIKKKYRNNIQYIHYFYPILKPFIDKSTQKQIENEISKIYHDPVETLKEKCQIGENELYICSLIRQDLVEEFISYINRANISLLTTIKPSIFETNRFLYDKEVTLIEYAAFFGSIQIFQYLKYNNVPLTSSLWLFAIHSNSAEMIHLLEENDIKPTDKTFKQCCEEAIKCHHNDIAIYIKENLLQAKDKFKELNDIFAQCILSSYNYYFLPDDISTIISRYRFEKGFNISIFNCCLTSITIPSSVTSIGNKCFFGCKKLTEISIPSSVKSVQEKAFDGIVTLHITGDINTIFSNMFRECTSLEKLIINSPITSIGDRAFSKCSSLTQITIPPSVTSIGESAFFKCTSLKQIDIPPSITIINKFCFSRCLSLKQIRIPSSVTSIEQCAFFKCPSLFEIKIPNSVTFIGKYCFSKCSSLTEISIPPSAVSIGNNAFSLCPSITKIEIPSFVKAGNIGFTNSKNLKIIYLQ